MLGHRKHNTLIYRILDIATAIVAFACFVYIMIEAPFDQSPFVSNYVYVSGIIVFWILLYALSNTYKDLYRLSRLSVFIQTFWQSLIGVGILSLGIIFIDPYFSLGNSYTLFPFYFIIHFSLTSLGRMALLTIASNRLKSGKVRYQTLIIGGNNNAVELYEELTSGSVKQVQKLIGFVSVNGEQSRLEEYIPKLGTLNKLNTIIHEYEVEEAIIATETSDHKKMHRVLDTLFDHSETLHVKIIPDMYDIISGSVKMNHIYGTALIEIENQLMAPWQMWIKRAMDICLSVIAILILLPLLIYIAIRVRLSSAGPIFYTQERIGKGGKPFNIIKFRSMYTDAEKFGPQLSTENDDRCTPWGAVMRKWRFDELPQFINVIKGDMSIVGPRPERQYYIDRIQEVAPHYKHLLKVRPGITSWGQVKYGYASNVDQMVQRLKYDILYVENMSLSLDFKILFYTALVLLQGKGK